MGVVMNKQLGRGLSAFLETENFISATEKSENNRQSEQNITKINLNDIVVNPFQPRQNFDEDALNNLADSIKNRGVLQPILVVENHNGKFQLVAGERRYRASKIAEMSDIPAIIVNMTQKEQLEVAILENVQRENLTPVEEADGYKRLISEFNYTQENVAKAVGKSRSHITNILRLLTLPDEIKDMLAKGDITFGHARALIGADKSIEIAQKIVDENLNVRQVEALVKNQKNNDVNENSQINNIMPSKKEREIRAVYQDPEILNIAQQMSSLLNLNVDVKLKNKGGIVEISFNNFQELDSLLNKFNR